MQGRRAAVVQEMRGEPQRDQRLGPELGRRRQAEADVREVRAHVVQQQIAVGGELLVAERRDGARPGAERRHVTGGAPALFSQIGCAACHVPTLRTGPSPIAALSNKQFAAYSDLLLHDMGPDLADICLGLATPAEFRTEPLIALRFATHFLHDGRATTLDQALAQHGGEAAGARDRFKALSPADSAALIMFLKSL